MLETWNLQVNQAKIKKPQFQNNPIYSMSIVILIQDMVSRQE